MFFKITCKSAEDNSQRGESMIRAASYGERQAFGA